MKQNIIWQTGEPKELGVYIVTMADGTVRHFHFQPKEAVDIAYFREFVTAWCKLCDIEPYKKVQPDNWTKFNEGEIVR